MGSSFASGVTLERSAGSAANEPGPNGAPGICPPENRPLLRGVLGADFIKNYPGQPHLTPEEAGEFGAELERARLELDRLSALDHWDS